MNYEVRVVNPKTNEECKIVVSLSPEQVKAMKGLEWAQEYVQALARPNIPRGFIPLGNGVRAVTLQ
ncbi:hypothetical protein [Bradyrhizobium sp. URHC0002]